MKLGTFTYEIKIIINKKFVDCLITLCSSCIGVILGQLIWNLIK